VLKPVMLAVLREESQEILDYASEQPAFWQRLNALRPHRPRDPWHRLRRALTVPVVLPQSDERAKTLAEFHDSALAYVEALQRLSNDALLGASWAPKALHEWLGATGTGRHVEFALPDEAGSSRVCELGEKIHEVPAGSVSEMTLNRVIAQAVRALESGILEAYESHWAAWGEAHDEWVRWGYGAGVEPELMKRASATFRSAAERYVPRNETAPEVLRGRRPEAWAGARRLIDRRLSGKGGPMTMTERQQVTRARRLLVAAVRGGHGESRAVLARDGTLLTREEESAARERGDRVRKVRRPITPVDPYEDHALVKELREILSISFGPAGTRGGTGP
jgi:hypothetical protein